MRSITARGRFQTFFRRTTNVSAWIAGSALCVGTSAFAAEQRAAEPTPGQTSTGAPQYSTEEIVVTAQRRSESVQSVPIAVTAVTPERIEILNLRDLPSLQQVTPGLLFNTGISYSQMFIRGVGYPNTTPGVETSVATYIDGAYLERGFGSAFDVLDPATLQVLKGPQGTLWGRNATGGAILISTADPTFESGGRVRAEVGDIGQRLGEAVVNVPIGDTVAVRLAGRYREQDGWVTNLAGGRDPGWSEGYTARAKLLFEPNDRFRAVAQVQVDDSESSSGLNAEYLPAVYCLVCAGSQFTLPVTDPYTTVNSHLADGGDDVSRFHNLQMSLDVGAVTIDSVTAYRNQENRADGDFDFTEVEAFNIAQLSGSETFTQDFVITTNSDGRFNGTGGVSYLDDKSYIFLNIYTTPVDPGVPTLNNHVDTESYSAFAEVTAEVVDDLKLTLGGRTTHDKRETPTQSVDFNEFTPRLVVAYETGPINLYASYNKGFKAGGFSTPAAEPLNVYKPEKIDSYEAGIKYLSSDNRVRANLAVFHYKQENLQVLAVDQGDVGNISQTQNADADGDGAEFEGEFHLTDSLQLFGGVAYLDAKYTSFEGAVVQVPVFDTSGNPTGIATGDEDLTGFRVPHAPEWTAFAGATLEVPLGSWTGQLTGFLRYSSDFDFYPGGGGPLRSDMQPSYSTAKLTGSLTSPEDRYRIGFFIDNLTDKTYYDFRFTTAPFGGMQDVARPRTYGVSLQYRWGP